MTESPGAALRRARLENNLRQDEVAKTMGIGAAYLSDIEHGKRGFPVDRLAFVPTELRQAVVAALLAENEQQKLKIEKGAA